MFLVQNRLVSRHYCPPFSLLPNCYHRTSYLLFHVGFRLPSICCNYNCLALVLKTQDFSETRLSILVQILLFPPKGKRRQLVSSKSYVTPTLNMKSIQLRKALHCASHQSLVY